VVIRRVVLARLCRATGAAMLLLAGQAATASAQAVTRFADLPLRLNTGDQVTIETRSGVSVAGRVVRMAPEQLAVTGPDARERVFAAAEVQRVRRRGDGLGNGVRIGAIAGGALGCGVFGAFSGECRATDCLQSVLIFGAVGAGLGLAVDAMHTGETTVFLAAPASARWRPRHAGGVALRAALSW
jgi:nitrous oxidase accessory protein NosD